MTSILVTGSNQGIGFGIIQQLVKRSDVSHIFATVRDPESVASADLRGLASSFSNIRIIQLTLDEKSAVVGYRCLH
jgi:NAD(P)-dependent dehydrogenase (short-subunit alcohol dehydrogenase family)